MTPAMTRWGRRGRSVLREGDIVFRHTALYLIDYRDHRRFRHFIACEGSGLQFLGAESMAGHVDHIIHAAEDPEVAVRSLHGDAQASAALGAAARALVETRYDWRAWVPGLLEVYVAQAPAC